MNSTHDPQVIFYLGPAGASKTRLALRTIASHPRNLIVTLDQDPYDFRICHAQDFDCSCRDHVTPLHGTRDVRIVGRSNWRREVWSERVYDRVFFKDLPEHFRQAESALELAQSLARLALLRSADVVASLDFSEADAIQRWEQSLSFNWQGRDHTIGFWMNAAQDPIRYLRMPATQLLRVAATFTNKLPTLDQAYENPR